MICLDTCGTAGDTICQDGGWGAYGSMCEFGTDCADCGPRLLLDPPPSPPSFPPPAPLSRVVPPGEEAAIAEEAQDDDIGLAIGLAFGGGLLVALLAVATCIWYRKRRMQLQTPTGSSTRAPQQVEVTVAQPDSQKV